MSVGVSRCRGMAFYRRVSLWCLPLGASLACSKIVGITDTEVTTVQGGQGGPGGHGGQGGVASGSGGAADSTSGASPPLPNGGIGGKVGASTAFGGGVVGGGARTDGTGTSGTATSGASAGRSGPRAEGGSTQVTGGAAPVAGTPSSAGGTSSDGGQGPGGSGFDGGSGASATCAAGDIRCGAGGREVCEVGEWKSSPCALNLPTCEAGNCIVRGPALVSVGDFYIDSTEVTAAQYREFLNAKGSDTSGQPSVCSWNTAYRDPAVPMNPDSWPMADVDWCDARAFCAWADKHLCGAVAGGPIARADLFSPTKSQWFLACGGPQGAPHPNANAVCNSSGGFDNLSPVASYPGCEGFYPGVFDLEGNVAEWVDGCDGTTGESDICYLVGGNIFDNRSYCNEVYATFPRNDSAISFGFRCCSG